MKKLLLNRLATLVMLSVILFACSKSDDGPSVLLPKLDGFYVYGTNTIAASPSDANARMSLAPLDSANGPHIKSLDGVYGKVLYLGANSTISFANVLAGAGTIYGAENGGTISNGKTLGFSVDDNVINGTLKVDAPAIKVADEGLYLAFVNTISGQFVIMPVKPDMIGPATPGGWATGTALPQISVSKDSAVYQASFHLAGGDTGYKYRLNKGGWSVYEDANIVGQASLAVYNYAKAWGTAHNDLGFYVSNIPQIETGDFIVQLKYTASTNTWTETKIRDYSAIKIGFFGSAWTDGAWTQETAYDVKVPTKSGNVYTWTWANAPLLKDGEFVVLENGIWGGLQLFWNDGMARAGDAFTSGKIIKGTDSENFHVTVDGTYNITLKLNAVTGVKTLTIN